MRELRTPFLSVDMILHTRKTEIILIERCNAPYGIALPGGFVDIGEDLIDAAKRETLEEVSCTTLFLRQFQAYGHPSRDPRFHSCSVVFYGQVKEIPRANDDAKRIILYDIHQPLPELQFDHNQILSDYLGQILPHIQEQLI